MAVPGRVHNWILVQPRNCYSIDGYEITKSSPCHARKYIYRWYAAINGKFRELDILSFFLLFNWCWAWRTIYFVSFRNEMNQVTKGLVAAAKILVRVQTRPLLPPSARGRGLPQELSNELGTKDILKWSCRFACLSAFPYDRSHKHPYCKVILLVGLIVT